MSRPGRAPAALLALSLLSACVATQEQVAERDSEVRDLQERVLRVERALEQGGPAPAAPAVPQDLATRLADLGQQVEAVTVDVRALQGRMDVLERREAQAAPEPTRSPEVEAQVSALAERVASLEAKATEPAPAFRTPQPAPPQIAPPAYAPAPTRKLSSQELYDQAYGMYKQGRYEEAREGFREYIRLYPDTNLTDNAHFWVGESFYDQGQYEQAILEYDHVVQKFPNGDKVASALLKQAFAFDAIDDPVDAKILLKKILREHPSSEQAAIAKRKLEILGE